MKNISDIQDSLQYIIFAFKNKIADSDIELFKENIGLLKYKFLDISEFDTFDECKCNNILKNAVIVTDNEMLTIKNGDLSQSAILGVGLDYR